MAGNDFCKKTLAEGQRVLLQSEMESERFRGRAAQFPHVPRVCTMSKFYRFFALGALIGLGAWLSGPSNGEPTAADKPLTSPPVAPLATRPAQNLETGLAEAKFAEQKLLTYQPQHGDQIFALQVQPPLPAIPVRKRDYVILVSTSAAQAGPAWVGANQI